ncbi:MAG: hypothetical protein HYV26_08610 [Candidatus Hydrogenedentes bacterium]|nr:hypothetical protein [Candidatus Hydrogenedentota bacterium]
MLDIPAHLALFGEEAVLLDTRGVLRDAEGRIAKRDGGLDYLAQGAVGVIAIRAAVAAVKGNFPGF